MYQLELTGKFKKDSKLAKKSGLEAQENLPLLSELF